MDVNKLSPFQIIVILGLFMGMLAAWIWADTKALDYMGPLHLHKNSNGALFIQMGNSLIEHDSHGDFVENHDLTKLGLTKFQGDFAFFNNGDVLLAKREIPPDLEENLSAYKRDTNQRPVESGNDGDGLFRCSLATYSCERFGDKTLDFGRAFHLYIAPEDEAVYVSDSSRHTLRKYNKYGKELASRESGFIFPNQILMHEDRLYITNTNNHSIQVVLPDTEQFARGIEIFDVRDPRNKTRSTKWPSSLLKAGNYWWINNMDSGMAYGSIDLYDENWKFQKSLELPEAADPQDIILFNDNVLLSDFSLHRIYQFDQNGEALNDFRSLELDQILDTQKEQHNYYNNLQAGILSLFALCVIAGFFIGLRSVLKTPEISHQENIEPHQLDKLYRDAVWLKPCKRFRRMKLINLISALIITISMAFIIVGFSIINEQVKSMLSIIVFGLIIISLAWLFYIYYKWIAQSRIGVSGNTLILLNHQGKHSSGQGSNIYYSDEYLAINDIAIQISSHGKKFFATEELVQHVYPLMNEAVYLENRQMNLLLLKRMNTYNLIQLALMVLLIIGFIALVL